jgi:hypothetical protein
VERPELERIAQPAGGGGEQVEDLQLADLVAEALPGIPGEEHRLLPGRLAIHRHRIGQRVGRGLDGELAERQRDVDLDPQCPQPHGVRHELGAHRGVVEQAGEQH